MLKAIDTERLRIRPFDAMDLDAVARLLDGCFAPAPRAQRQEWLEWCVRNYRAGAAWTAALRRLRRRAVRLGRARGLGRPGAELRAVRPAAVAAERAAECAVHAGARPVLGGGCGAPRPGALARFGFDALRAERLVATTERANAASVAVMRKLGMAIEANPTGEPFQVVGILFHPMR